VPENQSAHQAIKIEAMAMDVRESELRGGFKWLLIAGGAAVLLSCFLFFIDDVVMSEAPQRDKLHAAQMAELRTAQSSLGARVTDDRQILPLVMEQENHARDSHNIDSHH